MTEHMKQTKRILIATGGTGGHVYPAMALAQQLKEEMPNSWILFVGGGLNNNRFFDQNLFPHRSVSCGSFVNKAPMALVKSLSDIAKGIWQSRKIIQEFKPDVAVGFGSFYSFPPLVAAKLLSIPLVLHEANSIPGKVIRLLSPYAAVCGVHFPQTLELLKGNIVEVGMPLRNGFRRASISPEKAKKHFGLKTNLPIILIFGGSQGAKSINHPAFEAVLNIHKTHPLQVLHITGDADIAVELQNAYAAQEIIAKVKPFEDQMDIAWQAADFVVSRSGAGTIAEQLEFEVPGILIPYPRAADNHQEHNANFMVDTVGGAVKILESKLTADVLASQLTSFLEDDKLNQNMRQAMQSYKQNSRKQDLCSLVKDVLNTHELVPFG